VLPFLEAKDLLSLASICHYFQTMVATNDILWEGLGRRKGYDIGKNIHPYQTWKNVYMQMVDQEKKMKEEMEKYRLRYEEWLTTRRYVACGSRYGQPTNPIFRNETFVPSRGPVGGFQIHPNESPNPTVEFSVQLLPMVKYLLDFLNEANIRKELCNENLLARALHRYENFLRLKQKHKNLILIPTFEIEYVWVNHMLRPSMYREDCKQLLGDVIDHCICLQTMYLSMNKRSFLELTKKLYEEEYNEPYCDLAVIKAQKPMLINLNKSKKNFYRPPEKPHEIPVHPIYTREFGAVKDCLNEECKFSLKVNDLLMDAGWIDDFNAYMTKCLSDPTDTSSIISVESKTEYYNPPDLSTMIIYKNILKSYERFLYMTAKYPPITGYIHPTYAIDVMWHAHMICPKQYNIDISRLVGFLLDHDPWPMCSKEDISKNLQNSQDLWQQEFGISIDLDHQVHPNYNKKLRR